MNSPETIIDDPDLIDLYDISSLCNNMTFPPQLEDWTTSHCDYALIAVVALQILCNIQSKRFNIVQKVNTQFAFANNVFK